MGHLLVHDCSPDCEDVIRVDFYSSSRRERGPLEEPANNESASWTSEDDWTRNQLENRVRLMHLSLGIREGAYEEKVYWLSPNGHKRVKNYS